MRIYELICHTDYLTA